MRIDTSISDVDAGPATALPRRRRRGIDGVELAMLALLAAISLWVVALDVWRQVDTGLVWTGTDGFFIVDQMQYLAWIQSAAHHLLISNMFVLRGTPPDYFQPAMAISGMVTLLGVAPWLALMLWKPVAVAAIFFAARAYAYRAVTGLWARRAVIALALFFASFSSVFGGLGVVGDMMPTWLSWGYPFGLISVALIVFALLGYDRARTEGKAPWGPGLLGALASSLHPWQGELLILMLVISELIRWREYHAISELKLPVLTLVLTGLPLAYYLALGHLDLSWQLARDNSKHAFPFTAIAIGIVPLVLVAALGYRGRPRSFLELTTRVWPFCALLIYVFSATALSATPLHAFNGITLPLAVLAVLGVQRSEAHRLPHARLIGLVAVLAATVPATAYSLDVAHKYVNPHGGNADYIKRDERDALAYLNSDPDGGGVLTQFYLGEVVPARTGRQTLVGDCLWSEPNCMPRSETADALFRGTMSSAAARTFVEHSGARFILASCAPHVDLQRELGSLISSVRRFGCAEVLELRSAGTAQGPLASSSLHAAVRAPRRQ